MAATASKELHRLLRRAGSPHGPLPSITQEAVQESKETAFGEGGGCLATAATSTGCLLGAARPLERGTPPEATAVLVAGELAAAIESGACVDAQMQDQLVIFMALAQGTSRLRCSPLTLHTQTAMAVAQQLTGCKFRVATHHGGPAGSPTEQWLLECDGIGHSRQCDRMM
ncbi:hypothetical protein DUNSADRAFT_16804 [Dunaliella salina]|uniref:RNA 3'-terminal phosphate cyclase domain-containing protein n=1 Tax=Dunaliella salina TaxID=3046 RepID=A0ABQ7H0P5_DUNSA|nr:hypothetical protein DUNSADRAFT_16804 [Dunaliella salina]|eukprot:KAF5840427.1 hypothetical protein DUNSADRAFT_16804 [Dunaliella salina]